MTMTEMTQDTPVTDEEMEEQLPVPVGYRLLIALPKIEETYDSGIVKADRTKHEEQILSIVGLVLDMGSQAYADKDRYPEGPWCKAGDYVMFRANTGTRFRFNGLEYRLMNDDSIEAVVTDPRGVSRA
jgi:co-chaperonin GroES (HSP10)